MYLERWPGKLDSKPIASLLLTSCVALAKAINLSGPQLLWLRWKTIACQLPYGGKMNEPALGKRNKGRTGGRPAGKQQGSHRRLPLIPCL